MERNQNQSLGLSVRCFKQCGTEERHESVAYASDSSVQPSDTADDSGLNIRIGRLLNMLDK
jgi:hypothetical protein